MKSTGRCPKCGNDDIFIIDGYAGGYGSGSVLSYAYETYGNENAATNNELELKGR